MPSIRIVSAGAVAAIAVVLAVSGAMAQTAASDQAGKPLSLLAGLRPPHQTKAIVHAKTADKPSKKTATKKSAANNATKLARKKHNEIATTRSQKPAGQTAPAAASANVWPVAEATLPTDIATAPPPEAASAADESAPGAIVIGGKTVQIASPDQVNAIDLAADDDAAPTVMRSDGADAAPASQSVLAAPVRGDASQSATAVGDASWIAQVLAALGGAVAAGAVAWFLIGSGPQRMYG